MPQDADASTVVSLLLLLGWVYWSVYLWLERTSALGPEEMRRRSAASPPAQALPASGSDQTQPGLALEACAPDEARRIWAAIAEMRARHLIFSLGGFLKSATDSFETVVHAYNAGDRQVLEGLVADDVYRTFARAIEEREARGERAEILFTRITRAIVGAALTDEIAEVCVRFDSDFFQQTWDATGRPVASEPQSATEYWTFERPLSSRRIFWRVVRTASARFDLPQGELI